MNIRAIKTANILVAMLLFVSLPTLAQDRVLVTADNYVRAETDIQMKGYIDSYGAFGKFHHNRQPYDVNNQVTIRGNRDTLYSFGVWDLRSPVTITLPETGGRYQSLMVVSQDHSIWAFYGPRTGTLTEEKVGSRYVFLAMRTFMDPNDEEDMKAAYRLQDAIVVEQADIGKFEVPDWSKEEVEQMRETINVVASTVTDSSKMFGKKENLDPIYWLLGAALGWGGLPAEAASYANAVPEQNDGKTPYTLTVTDVPVYGFWSVTLYDDKGFMPVNRYNAYSFNNVTAKKDKDGSITIRFGGDPKADNFLPIVPGWNYIVRMYQPGPEILNGTWTFPSAQAVQ
ncbi:MAG: DUF1214 domain-containing protein [Nitrospira sp.]|nr:DUF1214 domain-containing protein [Nitrospira sp.]